MTTPSESAPALAGKGGGGNRSHKRIPAADGPDPMLIDAASAAVVLGIGTRTLWSLTNRKAVPSVRIGKRVLYRPEHLSAWLDAGAPTGPNAAEKLLRDLRRGGGR
jgi:hypothetical protein